MDINGVNAKIAINKIILEEYENNQQEDFSQQLAKKINVESKPQQITNPVHETPTQNNINSVLFMLLSQNQLQQKIQQPTTHLKCTCKKTYDPKHPRGFIKADPNCPLHGKNY